MTLELQPITFGDAVEFVQRFHRHHKPSVGWKFGIAVREIIDELYTRGDRIELFGRKNRQGWVVWGNEVLDESRG